MRLKNKLPIIVLLILPAAVLASVLPGDMHTAAMASIDAVFREDFKAAEDEARKIMRAYPDHPAGYFFMAAAADAWMLRYQSSRRESEFFRLCDQAIERAEKILIKDPGDEWARFFLGGADGYKGTYEVRYERYITGFRFGWKGVSVFMRMQSAGSSLVDINYGIGAYDYWRSAHMKLLWWMPGVPDNRQSGINKLKVAMENGIYTKTAAAMALIEIYINEKRFKEARTVADAMMKKYPKATVFKWGYAASSQGLGDHDEAIKTYTAILAKVENDPNSTFYNPVQARMGLARSLAAKGDKDGARAQLDEIGKYQLTRDIRKRLEGVLGEANTLRRRVS